MRLMYSRLQSSSCATRAGGGTRRTTDFGLLSMRPMAEPNVRERHRALEHGMRRENSKGRAGDVRRRGQAAEKDVHGGER